MTNIAIENGPFIVDLPNLKMVIVHSYVSLPEGNYYLKTIISMNPNVTTWHSEKFHNLANELEKHHGRSDLAAQNSDVCSFFEVIYCWGWVKHWSCWAGVFVCVCMSKDEFGVCFLGNCESSIVLGYGNFQPCLVDPFPQYHMD